MYIIGRNLSRKSGKMSQNMRWKAMMKKEPWRSNTVKW